VADERDETERREVQSEGRAPALLEEDEEPDEQVDDADEVDEDVGRRPDGRGPKVFERGVEVARLLRVRRLTAFCRYCSPFGAT